MLGLERIWSGGLHHPLCVPVLRMLCEEYFSKMEIFTFLENHW
jgi:hypothetical protein